MEGSVAFVVAVDDGSVREPEKSVFVAAHDGTVLKGDKVELFLVLGEFTGEVFKSSYNLDFLVVGVAADVVAVKIENVAFYEVGLSEIMRLEKAFDGLRHTAYDKVVVQGV